MVYATYSLDQLQHCLSSIFSIDMIPYLYPQFFDNLQEQSEYKIVSGFDCKD